MTPLTIGKRQGGFPGMLEKRTFNIMFVSKDKNVGIDLNSKPDRTIEYAGDEFSVKQ